MPVIDCHHHVWWLDKFPHQFPPSWGTSLNRDFTPDDLKPELDACGVDGTVLVQSLDKWEETPHYLDVADEHNFIRAVVGWVPLADPQACMRRLDELKSRKKFVGMRHLIVYEKDPRWLLQPTVQESLQEFARRGLAFEAITNTEEQMDTVLDTARRMPNLNIVLNHLGRPPLPEKGWEPWASQMVRAAELPNISVKLSVGGDVVWRWPWSTEEIRRYSDHVMRHFGPRRVMAGSNWPVVLISGSFSQVWRGIEELLTGLSPADRAEVLGGTAQRIYKFA
ncbi:MAG: amidohydrolase [Alphaproteobacteria bacterium]|nr:amidohydrolase [Alphaproteobacteria bacterium]